DAEAVSGDFAIVRASSGAPAPGMISRSRVLSLLMGGPLFMGNGITDAMRRSIRQKLCRYNIL
ncbi:MAG TPA: hypothetical protein VF760_09350, partial [Xanthobacteraceae bacterium]